MAGGIIFTAMGIYFLLMSYEKTGGFDKMHAGELEAWRASNKKRLKYLSILMIIMGLIQIAGLVTFW